jgi:uncharacterized oligopeptide transporter (OPT) family protein
MTAEIFFVTCINHTQNKPLSFFVISMAPLEEIKEKNDERARIFQTTVSAYKAREF